MQFLHRMPLFDHVKLHLWPICTMQQIHQSLVFAFGCCHFHLSFSYSYFSSLELLHLLWMYGLSNNWFEQNSRSSGNFLHVPCFDGARPFYESNRFYRTHEKWTTWATWMGTINIWKHIRFTVGRTDRPNQYSLIFLKVVIGLFSCCFASSVYIHPSPSLSFPGYSMKHFKYCRNIDDFHFLKFNFVS